MRLAVSGHEKNKYVVFVDYGSEGWKPFAESDDVEEAFHERDRALGCGDFGGGGASGDW